jgi:ABC-2 type transport system ATP-binding protein
MADSDSLAIDLRDVTKVYKGKVRALDGIEMRVKRGEVFGLLGPNGAGKSTLVKIMMTVVRPTHATGTILGHAVGHKAALRNIGYLPENHRFPRYLTGRQTLEFFAAMQKVDRPTRKRRAAELLEVVGMRDWGDRRVSTYSKGMMQRVGLAQALVADPDLVVLDEPTDGVDPVGRRDIRDVLLKLRDQGKTVFINSHLLSELESLCERVAILVKGRVATQGTIDELTVEKQRFDIELEPDMNDLAGQRAKLMATIGGMFEQAAPKPQMGPPPPPGSPMRVLPPLRGMLKPGMSAEVIGTTLMINVPTAVTIQPVLESLIKAGLVVRRINPFRQSLEDLFFQAVTDPTTGVAATPGAVMGARR